MFVIKNCRLIPELTEGFDRQMADVVVDGKFEKDKMDSSLQWKGSSNQFVIDVKNTLRIGELVLHG